MPRSPSLYSLPPGTSPQQPNTVIQSATFNAAMDDIAQTFNTPTPVVYGGTGASDVAGARTNLGVLPSDTIAFNYIINPRGTINQRGYVSGSATTAGNQYTVDRFRVVASGQSLSWTESGNVRTFTCPPGGIEQVVEGLNASGSYVLSWTGTATATVNGIATTSGSVLSLAGGVPVTIRWSSGTLSLPQLLPGTVAAPFTHRFAQQELALCQRYYQRRSTTSRASIAIGLAYNTVEVVSVVSLPVRMRAQPTLSSANLFITNGAGVLIAGTSSSISFYGEDSLSVSVGTGGGLTVGQASILTAGNGAGGYIAFDAEL